MGVGLCFGIRFIMVGGIPTPLKNMSSSVGMKFPIYGKIKKRPNYQPDIKIIWVLVRYSWDNIGF